MEGFSLEKIAGGKLIKVRVSYENSVKDVKITGDFFLYPDDGLDKIENWMQGISKDASEQNICDLIKTVIHLNRIQLIGIDAQSIARNVKKAMT